MGQDKLIKDFVDVRVLQFKLSLEFFKIDQKILNPNVVYIDIKTIFFPYKHPKFRKSFKRTDERNIRRPKTNLSSFSFIAY